MPKSWSAWTVADEEAAVFLRREGLSGKKIAAHLGRSYSSVQHKLMRLNAGTPQKMRHFSKVELRRLRRMYAVASWEELERAFPGRSRDSISQAGQRLGVRRTRSWDCREEIAHLARLPETDLAYLAGIIDGEGSVIRRANGQPELSMGNTSAELIAWVQSRVGGHIRYFPDGDGIGRKPFYRWRLARSRLVTALLERMRPYLLIKS